MTDEEYARSVWHQIDVLKSGEVAISWISGNRAIRMRFGSWAAAADFTRAREEEVRQVEEEIQLIIDETEDTRKHIPENIEAFQRILGRLQAILYELKRGMKESK